MRSGFKLVQNVTYKSGQVVADSANAIIPHRTGAVDVMVVEQPDGSIRASPFYVRFGKYAALVGNKEVNIEVNGHKLDFSMTLERYGTAYFTREIPNDMQDDEDDDANLTGMMSPPSGYASGDDDSPFTPYEPVLMPPNLEKSMSHIAKLDTGLVSPKKVKPVRRALSAIDTRLSSDDVLQGPTTAPVLSKHNRSFSIANTQRLESQEISMRYIDKSTIVRSKSHSHTYHRKGVPRINTGLSSEEDQSEEDSQMVQLYRSDSKKSLSASPSLRNVNSMLNKSKKVFSSAPYLGVSPPISPRVFGRNGTLQEDVSESPKASSSHHVHFQAQLSNGINDYDNSDAVFLTSETFQGFHSLAGSTDDTSDLQFKNRVKSDVSFDTIPVALNNSQTQSPQQKDEMCKSAFEAVKTPPILDSKKDANLDEQNVSFSQGSEQESQQQQEDGCRGMAQLSLCWEDLVEIGKREVQELRQGVVEDQEGEQSGSSPKGKQVQQFQLQVFKDKQAQMLKAFESKQVEEKYFLENVQKIIQDRNLAVRIGGRVYQFQDIFPQLVGIAIFGLNTDKALESLDNSNLFYFNVESEKEIQGQLKLKDRSLGWTSYLLSFLSKKDMVAGDERPRRKVVYPTEEQLQQIAPFLHEGSNRLEYVHSTGRISCHMYKVKWDQKLVVSDVDGTITISDVLGHVLPAIGWDWFQPGICQFFTNIRSNGYHMMYLSSRAIAQALQTREMLYSISQEGCKIPQGPVVISPEGILPSLYREVIQRRPHEFKIKALMDIRRLFPEDVNPFYAGFGNRDTDERSYAEAGIPLQMIFTINPKGKIKRVQPIDSLEILNLTVMNENVNQLFPPLAPPPNLQTQSTDNNNVPRHRHSISISNTSDVFEEVIEHYPDEDVPEVVLTPYSPI